MLAATFALSWATYRGLELPARRYLSRPVGRVVLLGAATPITASVALAFGIVAMHGLPARFPETLNKKSEALLAFPNKARGRCNEGPPANPLPPEDCVLGRAGGKVNFLLVGDSHANHFTGFMDELGKAAGMRGYDMTRSNTPYLPGVDRWMMRDGVADHHENFVPRNVHVSRMLDSARYDAVILAGNYTGFFADEIVRSKDAEGPVALEQGLRSAIKHAKKAAPRVLVIETVPLLQGNLHDCSLRAERFQRRLDCTFPAGEYLANTAGVRALFKSLKRDFPDVIWVEPDKLLCDQRRCLTEMEGVPLYKDRGHLNDVGSRLLAKKWIEKYGNPLVVSSDEFPQRVTSPASTP